MALAVGALVKEFGASIGSDSGLPRAAMARIFRRQDEYNHASTLYTLAGLEFRRYDVALYALDADVASS